MPASGKIVDSALIAEQRLKDVNLTKKRILVVDDDEQVLFVWRHALAKMASTYQVETATSGRAAVQAVTRSPFDLIVTDLSMEGMSGQELTQVIRGINPCVAIVWMTGYPTLAALEDAQRLSVHCCLYKPFPLSRIRQVVSEALETGALA